MTTHVLALRCADAPGIVANVSTRLYQLGANIVENAQFTDATTGTFCMRTVFDIEIDSADHVLEALTANIEHLDASLWL